jgi:hypothetical protein
MGIGQNLSNFSVNQGLKKSLEEKISEKSKIYGFIGMETYDLYKAGKIAHPELDIYFEKMKELEQEIANIQTELDKAKNPANGTTRCSCGNVLTPGTKFCPQCGKVVESDTITCKCGQLIKRDMMFCPYCGQKVSELLNTSNGGNIAPGKQCICGAIIPAGQSMCMECGRMVTD